MLKRVLHAIEWAMSRPIEYVIVHFENRLIELAMATIFLVESIFLVFSPGSMEAGGMAYLSQMMNLPTVVLLFFSIGAGRIVALALNGHWMPHGAYVRAFGAALGAVMWLQVAAALVVFATQGNAIPFSTPVYGVLAVFEAISMFRALAGAKRNGRHRSLGEDVGMGERSNRIAAAYLAGQPDRSGNRGGADRAAIAGRVS